MDSFVAQRHKVGEIEFWTVRDGKGGYTINDTEYLPKDITDKTYTTSAQAYLKAWRYITGIDNVKSDFRRDDT